MDITRFDTKTRANDGIEFELRDLRTGKGSGVFFRVLGTDGDTFQRLKTERARTIAKKMEEMGSDKLSGQEIDDMTSDMLANCTIGWRSLELNGEPYPFSLDNAKKVYRDYPAIRDEINVAVANRANFLLA